MDTSVLGLVQLGTMAAINVAVAILAGCIVSLWMLRRADTAWAKRRIVSTCGALRAGAIGFLLADGLLLWVQAAVMTEQPLAIAAPAIGRVAVATQVGHAGLVAAAAALVLLAASFLRRRRDHDGLLTVAGVCFLIIASTRSWASHAGATGHLVPAVIDWLHVLSTSAWAGAVFLTAALLLRGPEPADLRERNECVGVAQSLSTVATWSLAGVLLTGALSAWRALGGTLDPLLRSTYGELLVIKLVLVAIASALGAHNRFFVLPPLLASLKSPRPPIAGLRLFRNVLTWEALAFIGALGMAAALGIAPPPDLP